MFASSRGTLPRVRPVSRRELLRTVAAGAFAVPWIVPSRVLGAAAPSNRLNIAAVGTGGRCRLLLQEVLRQGGNVVALCDVDERQIVNTRKTLAEKIDGGATAMAQARVYADYRKLFDAAASFDGAVIATGSRWHAPLSVRAMKAGKHVYCEKPLVRRLAEARELSALASQCKVATQTGTQGGSGKAFRRSVEILQAGLLGQVERLYLWSDYCGVYPPSHNRPVGEDPLPAGLNWDFWLGPCPWRPFKAGVYLPGCLKAQNWLDLCNGMLAGQGGHTFQLPVMALRLGAPVRVTAELPEPLKETYVSRGCFQFEYPARGHLAPVKLWWGDGGKYPPDEITASLKSLYGQVPNTGCLFVGQRGQLFTTGWGGAGIMKLQGERAWRGVLDHEAAKPVPYSLPRAPADNHMREWFEACKGGPATFTNFTVGARVVEAHFPGILALRLGRPITWDSVNLRVTGAPEADRWIQKDYRTRWLT